MIYICGDSFAVSDIEYGPCWVDLLAELWPTTSLAQVCASNLMIAQQIDHALSQPNAEYIIALFTASTRGEVRYNNQVTPYSILSLDNTTPFDSRELAIIKSYTAEFFDLDLAIYQNQCTIESALARLQRSGIAFCWDQGGFEHASYGAVPCNYFEPWHNTRSALNLWDFAPERRHRPYYHIEDPQQHIAIAAYYYAQVRQA